MVIPGPVIGQFSPYKKLQLDESRNESKEKREKMRIKKEKEEKGSQSKINSLYPCSHKKYNSA